MTYAAGSGSSASSAGTKFIRIQIRRTRDGVAQSFNQSKFLEIRAVEVSAGSTAAVLDSVLVNTARFPSAFSTTNAEWRGHLAYWDQPIGAVKKIYITRNGVRVAELNVAGFTGSWNKLCGASVDGDSDEAASVNPAISKPARARGFRVVKVAKNASQPASSEYQDVVLFTRGAVDVGTLGPDLTLRRCLLQTNAADPPGGAPPNAIPGLLGSNVQAVGKVITQADNAGVSKTRMRILAVDGENADASSLIIVDPVDGRVCKWNVNNPEVYGCRLIALMGDRIYLIAPKINRSMYFASAIGKSGATEPHLNFNPSDAGLPAPQRAFVGTDPNVGRPADSIVGAVALSNRRLLFGCTRSFYMLNDDPGFGGQCVEVSRSTGMMGPRAYAFDDKNNLYVMTPGGLFVVPSGSSALEQVSGDRLPDILDNIDVNANQVEMGYKASEKLLYIAITPRNGLSPSVVIPFDLQRNAFWKDAYPVSHGPRLFLSTFGRTAEDRNILFCGNSGFVYRPIAGSSSDDGEAFDSYVRMRPIEAPMGMSEVMAKELRLTAAVNSGPATAEWRTGQSPADVSAQDLSSTPATSFTVFAKAGGEQRGVGLRRRAPCHQLVIRKAAGTATSRWAFERAVVTLEEAGGRKNS